MRQTKKLLMLMLCLIIIMTIANIIVSAADVPSEWAVEQVNAAIEKNFVPQNLQSDYSQAITRAEFCAIVVALYENVRGAIAGHVTFVDTDDINVQKAAYIGLVNGVGNNRFEPNAVITREQAMIILSRLAAALDNPNPFLTYDSVWRVQTHNIMHGAVNNRFVARNYTYGPQRHFTREQAIVSILRLFEFMDIDLLTSQRPTMRPAPRPTPNFAAMCNQSRDWYFVRNPNNQPPRGRQTAESLRPFDAFFIGDTTQQRVFLTFDAGYERGFTAAILDTLRDHDVHAAFFLTESYIRNNPELTQRKIDEGHLMANHSVTHRAMPRLTDAQNADEILRTSATLKELTGHTMSPFFRPPEGVYSERTLAITQYHGYYTVFWSFAHMDWAANHLQPPPSVTFDRVMSNLHNGMIILLHSISQSNTLALPDIIEAIREAGFTFGSLYELPNMWYDG